MAAVLFAIRHWLPVQPSSNTTSSCIKVTTYLVALERPSFAKDNSIAQTDRHIDDVISLADLLCRNSASSLKFCELLMRHGKGIIPVYAEATVHARHTMHSRRTIDKSKYASKPSSITQQNLISTSGTDVWNPLVEAGPIRRPCSHQIACEQFKKQMII